MFNILENIGHKNSVILRLKSNKKYNINYIHIYLNALILMVVFIGMFFLVGLLFKLQYNIRYMFYSISLSWIVSYVLVKIMIELKIQVELDIEYNPLLPIINDIFNMIGIVYGLLFVIFAFIMPETTNVIDIIVTLLVFLISLIYFYSWGATLYTKNTIFIWSVIVNIFIHSLLFILIQVVFPISEPWLWSVAYLAFLIFMYLIKDLLYKWKGAKLVIDWRIISVLIVFVSYIFFVVGDSFKLFSRFDVGGNYSRNIVVDMNTIEFDIESESSLHIDLIYFEVDDNHYYLVEKRSDDHWVLHIFSKDNVLVKSFDFSDSIEFRRDESHLYLYERIDRKIHIHELNGETLTWIGEINKDSSLSVPIIVNDEYYIINTPGFMRLFNDTGIFKLSEPENILDGSNMEEKVLYKDNHFLVFKPIGLDTYQYAGGDFLNYNFHYSNGYLGYRDGDYFYIQTLENYYLENKNYIKINIDDENVYYMYVYDNDFYLIIDSTLIRYDNTGRKLGSIYKSYALRQTKYENKWYLSTYSNKVRFINLDNKPVFRTVFRTISFENINSYSYNREFYWTFALTPLIMVVIILKSESQSNWKADKDHGLFIHS